MTAPIRIGIMSFAHLHAEGYVGILQAMPGVTYVGTADPDTARRQRYAQQYGSPYFESYDALFDAGVDGVIVCTENSRHREAVEMAAARGVHVLCEKPIATTLDDGAAMMRACDDAGVHLMIAFPMRFSAAARDIKAGLERGDLGRVRCANCTNQGENPDYHRAWFSDKTLAGGGAVMDHTVHVVDLMRWYTGAEPTEVYAEVDNLFKADGVDDTAGLLMIQFDNGTFISLDTSWSRPAYYPMWGNVKIDLVCEKGIVRTDYFKQRLTVYDGALKRPMWAGWGSDPNAAMIAEFVASVRESRMPGVTGHDGQMALRAVMAAYESARTGRPAAV